MVSKTSVIIPPTHKVTVRGLRYGTYYTMTLRCHIYHASLDVEVSPEAAMYKFALRYDREKRFSIPEEVKQNDWDDLISMGDVVIWSDFPGQSFDLSRPQNSQGAFRVTTAYFMEIGK